MHWADGLSSSINPRFCQNNNKKNGLKSTDNINVIGTLPPREREGQSRSSHRATHARDSLLGLFSPPTFQEGPVEGVDLRKAVWSLGSWVLAVS